MSEKKSSDANQTNGARQTIFPPLTSAKRAVPINRQRDAVQRISSDTSDVQSHSCRFLGKCDEDITSLAFSPDGKLIAVGSSDKSVRLWDTESGLIEIRESRDEEICSIAFSPDGELVAIGCLYSPGHHCSEGISWSIGGSYSTVQVWNIKTGNRRKSGRRDGYSSDVVVFSNDGKQLYSIGPGTISTWDVKKARVRNEVKVANLFFFRNMIAIAPDRKNFVVVNGRTIRIRDIKTGQIRAEEDIKGASVDCVAYSPDNRRIAFGMGGWDVQDTKDEVCIWEVKIAQVTKLGHCDGFVKAIAFSPDGEKIATGSSDRTVRIWELNTGKMWVMGQCDDEVISVLFSQDNKSLASASLDKTVRVWNV